MHRNWGSNFRFHQFAYLLSINTYHGVYVPERIKYVSTPPHHTLKSTASACSLGQLESKYLEEGRDKELPLEFLHFPISPRFTERFWHISKYFFALADCQNDYLKTLFTKDVAPYHMYQNYYSFYLQFAFLHLTQMDVNKQTHKVNRTKIIHTIHFYHFFQHHFHGLTHLCVWFSASSMQTPKSRHPNI